LAKLSGIWSEVNRSIAAKEESHPVGPEQAHQAAVLQLIAATDDTGASTGISAGTDADVQIAALKQELRAKDEYLQTSNEELETSNEELKSSNEEMQSVNEELQSSNEELETSKEELQSVNEELATVNNELQTKVADLSQANNDMNNLLAGTGIGTVFVDHHQHILRFTPAASVIINLILSDVGRPLGHIVSNLVGYDRMVAGIQAVLNTLIPKDMGRIFDPFQQAATGMKAGGTGLGLAISRKFVEMMGGELTVTSQVGSGSRFRFEALLAQAGDIVEQEKPALRCVVGLEPGAGPFRILVVDDIPDNRTLLCELLRPVGFEVAEASNGVGALDVFANWSPHAVLMDMRMPIMDGYEATRRIKATAAGDATPVIAVTASALEDDFERVMATGMFAYLRKPFRREDLFEMLGKCLGLHYVFADHTADTHGLVKATPLTAESITALPKDIVEAMRQAVEEGDMVRLTELVAQVEKIDSATARGLQVLTDRYDYEKLGQWLEKGGTDK
jgi:CheY-like chemotaxis protein